MPFDLAAIPRIWVDPKDLQSITGGQFTEFRAREKADIAFIHVLGKAYKFFFPQDCAAAKQDALQHYQKEKAADKTKSSQFAQEIGDWLDVVRPQPQPDITSQIFRERFPLLLGNEVYASLRQDAMRCTVTTLASNPLAAGLVSHIIEKPLAQRDLLKDSAYQRALIEFYCGPLKAGTLIREYGSMP